MSFISKTIKKLGPNGLYKLGRFVTRNEPKILMYHRFSCEVTSDYVSTEAFERQLQYIIKHFEPKTMAEIGKEIFETKSLNKNSIAITIDDGYQDFYQYAFPLLQKYKIPATLYVTTGFVENKNWLWPDKISWLLKSVAQPRPHFSFDKIELSAGFIELAQIKKDWRTLVDYLLSIENHKKEECIGTLAKIWGLDIPLAAPSEYAPCTIEQLQEMQAGGIEIGGHTINHPSLGHVSPEEVKEEIIGCENWLNENLGEKMRSFCYPNGTEFDFNDSVINVLEHKTKFNCSVTAFADEKGAEYRYAIRRHTGSENMFQFYKSITGIELLGNKVRSVLNSND